MSSGRRQILIAVLIILIVGTAAFIAYDYYKNRNKPVTVTPTPSPTSQPTPVPSVIPAQLDGVLTEPNLPKIVYKYWWRYHRRILL